MGDESENSTNTSNDPFLGMVFNGRYEVIKKVGKGSYGAVYLCRDYYLGNNLVALKVLHPKVLRSANAAKRLAQEIQAANRIDHQNIVRFYDFFRCFELCVITMEYVEGPSLRQCIEEKSIPGYSAIADIGIQICTGLQVIHHHDIIHRDMKPDNILLADGWIVKITDFGIAYLIDGDETQGVNDTTSEGSLSTSETNKKQLVGTMRYISPESISYGAYEQRSDIYAVGVILYEMIVGHYFFTYKNFKELMKLKVEMDPIPPSEIRDDCPEMLNKICMKALQRNPDNRYQCTEEIIDDFNILRSELSGNAAEIRTESLSSRRINKQVSDIQPYSTLYIISLTLVIFLIVAAIGFVLTHKNKNTSKDSYFFELLKIESIHISDSLLNIDINDRVFIYKR